MNRIDQTFKMLRNRGRVALIPFIVAGDPDLDMTETLIIKMAESGADMIELGVPFSDPLADGPVIQAASQRALRKGTHLEEIFRLTQKLNGMTVPLILMTYFNPVLRYGLRGFAEKCHQNGIDGVILPDLPIEEAGSWIKEARPFRIDTIFLATPTSSPERIRQISKLSQGFIYYVSVTGVTGTREKLPEELEWAVREMKGYSKKPVAVGFGISTPEQAKRISHFADGVIVGSAIVRTIEENLQNPDMVSKVGEFISSLSNALKS